MHAGLFLSYHLKTASPNIVLRALIRRSVEKVPLGGGFGDFIMVSTPSLPGISVKKVKNSIVRHLSKSHLMRLPNLARRHCLRFLIYPCELQTKLMDRPVLLLASKSGLSMGVSSGKVRFHNLLLQLLSKEVAIQEQQERFFAPGLPAGGVLSFSSPCFKLIVSGSFSILFRGTRSLVVIRAGGP